MSEVNGIGGNSPVQRILSQPILRDATGGVSSPTRGADKLELSGMSHLLRSAKSGIRTDKVAAIKAEIEAGTYENDAKLDLAINRMLDDLI